ncbi:very short patch repair endonuclease [Streptacidiphilus neutrinimicus]|uniref:very short patch repair endonuclease n=1 Tax=Streptacidiphilus neutrinimicus TaxID=105420 RepID=UPI000A07AEC7|nr:very short patch repair endonuclease [Streptacidiphilus neutrinimicus]
MSRQASRNTSQEVAVRRLLYHAGFRYRVNVPVPGMPRRTVDILFRGPKVAVFLDGCFWHGCPQHATSPKSNAQWWRSKLDRNIARDQETTDHLRGEGWTVLRFWEHEPSDRIAASVAGAVRGAVASKAAPSGAPRLSAPVDSVRCSRRPKETE